MADYPVTAFEGTKSIILTTTSWLGGKNPFLGIAYLVVGSLCIVLGIVFLIIHLKWGKRYGPVACCLARLSSWSVITRFHLSPLHSADRHISAHSFQVWEALGAW